MSKHLPDDFSLAAMMDRVAPVLGLHLAYLILELDFPRYDHYTPEAGQFWHAETVRQGVSAITRGELAARPSQLRELTQLVQFQRRAAGKTEMSDSEAREAAIQNVITERLKKIFDDWWPAA